MLKEASWAHLSALIKPIWRALHQKNKKKNIREVNAEASGHLRAAYRWRHNVPTCETVHVGLWKDVVTLMNLHEPNMTFYCDKAQMDK